MCKGCPETLQLNPCPSRTEFSHTLSRWDNRVQQPFSTARRQFPRLGQISRVRSFSLRFLPELSESEAGGDPGRAAMDYREANIIAQTFGFAIGTALSALLLVLVYRPGGKNRGSR